MLASQLFKLYAPHVSQLTRLPSHGLKVFLLGAQNKVLRKGVTHTAGYPSNLPATKFVTVDLPTEIKREHRFILLQFYLPQVVGKVAKN
jgi:hypothetical protein